MDQLDSGAPSLRPAAAASPVPDGRCRRRPDQQRGVVESRGRRCSQPDNRRRRPQRQRTRRYSALGGQFIFRTVGRPRDAPGSAARHSKQRCGQRDELDRQPGDTDLRRNSAQRLQVRHHGRCRAHLHRPGVRPHPQRQCRRLHRLPRTPRQHDQRNFRELRPELLGPCPPRGCFAAPLRRVVHRIADGDRSR